jgi:hypothetical protein
MGLIGPKKGAIMNVSQNNNWVLRSPLVRREDPQTMRERNKKLLNSFFLKDKPLKDKPLLVINPDNSFYLAIPISKIEVLP